MKRYTPLLLTAFLLFLIVTGGVAYIADSGQKNEQRPQQELTVYTTLPPETVTVLATEYEKEQAVRINFVPLSQVEILERLKKQSSGADSSAAMVLADSRLLDEAVTKGYLLPYLSEAGDQVPDNLRQKDAAWTGVWYDPVVFCVNNDYLKTLSEVPDNWVALAKQKNVRLGVTDFLAAEASANLFIGMIAQFGDVQTYNIWRSLHPKVVQYARYLSNPVRQAGMGEVDVAIAVESEAIRYQQDGYPLKIIYPADGTAAMVFGTALLAGSKESDLKAAQKFADFLLSDEAMLALQSNGFYFVPTNPGTLAYKMFAGKNLLLFNQPQQYSDEQRHAFLDRWVKEVRFQ